MDDDFCPSPLRHSLVSHGMINMRMGIHNVFDSHIVGLGFFEKNIMVVGWIYKKTLARLLVPDQIAEYTKITYFNLFYDHASISDPLARALPACDNPGWSIIPNK
jgi:hypothetical protein